GVHQRGDRRAARLRRAQRRAQAAAHPHPLGGGHGRMNQRPRTGYDELTPALAQRIDALCDRLEKAWQAGQRPLLEEYVGEVPEPAIPVLLRELILVDAIYRRRAGEDVQPADYQARFPALDAAWLAEALSPATVLAPPSLAPLPSGDKGRARGAVPHDPA